MDAASFYCHAEPPDNSLVRVFDRGQLQQFSSLAEAFYYNAAANPLAIAYDQAQRDAELPSGKRRYVETTHAESRQRVLKSAAFLQALGVGRGDAVAVLSLDRPEWTEAEMAIHTVGAHVVPAYVRDMPERLAFLLRDAGAAYAFVENQQQLEKVLRLNASDCGVRIKSIITFEPTSDAQAGATEVHWLGDILTSHAAVLDENSFAFRQTTRSDLACIYYTSGSSGQPKGVPVTHGQILANLHQLACADMVDYDKLLQPGSPQPIVTFLLPERAHAYPARSAQLVAVTPARARYPAVVNPRSSDIDETFRQSVRRDLREGGAGVVPVVPKIAIAIHQRVRQRLSAGTLGQRLASLAIDCAAAQELRRAADQHNAIAAVLTWCLSPLRRRAAGRIRREIVGPEFEYFISGGAKLPVETAVYLTAIGLPIYEGYGSTETNCPIATSTPQSHRLGSVGKLLAGVEVRIDAATDELLVKGPNVAAGYFHAESVGDSAWDADGWYHTRDKAALDNDGYLRIEERLDNMLVLLNGENVSPVAMEGYCSALPGVEAAIVLGDHRPALVALLALDEAYVRKWASDTGLRLGAAWQRDPAVLAWLREMIEQRVNSRAGHVYERIRNVAVIDVPTVERQTLTATEKIRRKEIERRYAGLIDELYEDPTIWISPENLVVSPVRRVAAL